LQIAPIMPGELSAPLSSNFLQGAGSEYGCMLSYSASPSLVKLSRTAVPRGRSGYPLFEFAQNALAPVPDSTGTAADACEAYTLALANVRGGDAAVNRRELVGLMGLSAGNFALAQPGVRGSLIGVWTLESCVRTFAEGHNEYPFGEKPVGRIEYDKEGRMFALLMRPGRRSTLAPGLELDAANVEEIREAVTGFVAYFGSYEVDDASQTVTHHVKASLVPSWVGTSLKRSFRWDGARLVLTRAVPGTTDELVWERA